jgi:hypothetical protein
MADASQLAQLVQRLDRMESQIQSNDDDAKRQFAALGTEISEQADQVNDQQEAMEHLMGMMDTFASTDVSVSAMHDPILLRNRSAVGLSNRIVMRYSSITKPRLKNA